MTTESIPLRFSGRGRIAQLRELTGREEHAVAGADTAHAIGLLAALLVEPPGDEAIQPIALSAADRDRMLAGVYRGAFGDRIESTLTCRECGRPFDLHFSLRELMQTLEERAARGDWKPDGDGHFESAGGERFRLPTGRDELDVAGLPASESGAVLFNRCTEGRGWPGGLQAFEETLETVAPLIDLELLARCPECNSVQPVQFEIQGYLLSAILAERRQLRVEIHRIAKAYGWSLHEILSLTRSDRRHFVELVENQPAG